MDAVSYLACGVLTSRVGVHDPRPAAAARPALLREAREGLSWVYRHRTLRPLALSGPAWFLCFSLMNTVYVPFVLRDLGFDAFVLGVTFALAGVGALAGNGVSARLGSALGICSTIAGSRGLGLSGFRDAHGDDEPAGG